MSSIYTNKYWRALTARYCCRFEMPNDENAVDIEYGVTVRFFAFTIIGDRNFNPYLWTNRFEYSFRKPSIFTAKIPKKIGSLRFCVNLYAPPDTFNVPISQIRIVNGGKHSIDRRSRPIFLRPETNRTCSWVIGR